MRGEPDQLQDLDEPTRRYEDRGKPSESYHYRRSPLTIGTKTPPGRCESPTIYPPSPPPSASNPTPLLTATLNAPVAYHNGIRAKSDLPSHLTNKSKPDESNNSLSYSQSSFYSTLIHQLRHKTGDAKPSLQVQSIKIKKEKSKPLPFMCPACKKRFQRHIALNAHVQNEHISLPGAGGERTCKLCGGSSASLAAVRQHLRVVHNINLDNPTKCSPEESAAKGVAGTKFSVLETTLRLGYQDETEPSCSNIEMYESGQSSPSPAHTPTSSQSPERALFPLKQEGGFAHSHEDDPQVEDLSIRKASPASPLLARRFSPAPCSPPPDSPCAKQTKSGRLRETSTTPPLTGGQGSGFTCSHCSIVYPNQTLYFLHRGFHSESNPWRCNSCGHISSDLYDFNTHLVSVAHQ